MILRRTSVCRYLNGYEQTNVKKAGIQENNPQIICICH